MRRRTLGLLLSGLACALPIATLSRPAAACGGFFCASTPVDQNAERVLFKVRPDGRTDMIVQITYQGKAEDFAWVLPLAEPPKKEDLGVFPQRALTALDAQSGPVLYQGCVFASAGAGGTQDAGTSVRDAAPVDVYVRAQIGNYDVAVIGSADAEAAAQWLTDNGFRISDPMKGYIELYTKEGMKFLALKLLPEKTANDITPFKLTLPGTSPSIPLRLSAVAAEPEMGIVVWVLGDKRYEPANAPDLTIDDDDIRFENGYYGQSNWTTLVARAVDEHQGMGFVTEYAESTANLKSLLMNSFANTPEQQEAATALGALFEGTTYITRMYTRVSPEEMTYDPIFRTSAKGDVSRYHMPGSTSCVQTTTPPSTTPCDFTACGALGLCREVSAGDGGVQAGCACAGGSTARTTFVPNPAASGFATTVSCVDQRLSYLNPGDRNAVGEVLPDPCVGVDCGGHGKCVAMNMTATCDCDPGYVALGSADDLGNRFTTCALPKESIPPAFYNRRPLPRDPSLPIGREFAMPAPTGSSDNADPLPEGNAMATPSSQSSGGGCAVGTSGDQDESTPWAYALSLLGLTFALRRRRR